MNPRDLFEHCGSAPILAPTMRGSKVHAFRVDRFQVPTECFQVRVVVDGLPRFKPDAGFARFDSSDAGLLQPMALEASHGSRAPFVENLIEHPMLKRAPEICRHPRPELLHLAFCCTECFVCGLDAPKVPEPRFDLQEFGRRGVIGFPSGILGTHYLRLRHLFSKARTGLPKRLKPRTDTAPAVVSSAKLGIGGPLPRNLA